MKHSVLVVAALQCSSLLLAAAQPAIQADDVPAPASFHGTWKGQLSASFALANPNVPNSFECLPGGATVSVPHSLAINATSFVSAAWQPAQITAGGAAYTFPGRNIDTFYGWSEWDSTTNILRLRYSAQEVECHFLKLEGNTLTMVSIGGAQVGFDQQCDPSSYSTGDVPQCERAGGNSNPSAAYQTTLVAKYTRVVGTSPSANVRASGAAATSITSVAATAAALLAAFCLQL